MVRSVSSAGADVLGADVLGIALAAVLMLLEGSRKRQKLRHVLILSQPRRFGGIYMKRLCLLALATGFFSACTPPPFTPQTLEGARCKLDCNDRASVMPFGNSYGRCIEACIDIDRLYKTRETTP